MKYDVFPRYNDIQNIKQYWTKQEIISLLERKSHDLSNQIDYYDGLVVIISSHGIDGNILTSDYKKLRKQDIHRIFSAMNEHNAINRIVPRICIFDSCDGSGDKNSQKRVDINRSKKEIDFQRKQSAHVYEKVRYSINMKRQMTDIWAQDEYNCDHKVVIINSANDGFESKMRRDKGSYFINAFIKRIEENDKIEWICNFRNKLFLGDIITDIQNKLESNGKQLATFQHFNGTDKIVFVKNHNKSNVDLVNFNDNEDRNRLIKNEVELQIHGNKNEKSIDSDSNDEQLDYLHKVADIIMNKENDANKNSVDMIQKTQQHYGEILNSLGVNIKKNNSEIGEVYLVDDNLNDAKGHEKQMVNLPKLDHGMISQIYFENSTTDESDDELKEI
eukprot:389738_1